MAIIYSIVIKPIEYLIEFIFFLTYRLTGKEGVSVIFVSVAVSILTLPLYKRAEQIQEEERNRQKAMSAWVDHINKTFRGDERFMMLSAFYRENHYHPLYSLRSSLSLLLQIPFFIAAYHYLSNLSILSGRGFLFIQDLALPDGMLRAGQTGINVLPFVMTGINVCSSIVYLKDYSLRDKVQQFGMALIFLVLLYNSPAGLVLYWTCNNLFSLVKVLLSAKTEKARMKEKTVKDNDKYTAIFFGSGIAISMLIGMWIPASVINDSVHEFLDVRYYLHPLNYVIDTTCITFGLFVLWGGVWFFLTKRGTRRVMARVLLYCLITFIMTHILLGRNLGFISTDLVFDVTPSVTMKESLIHLMICVAVAVAMIIGHRNQWTRLMVVLSWVLCIGVAGVALNNARGIHQYMKEHPQLKEEAERLTEEGISFPMSRDGKNVIFIMLDRGISAFYPYIIAEKPEIKEAFSGFKYFPNTISYARMTSIGTDALFGGYEYTPIEMNRRDDQLMVDKHNEALKLMPVLFWENGYRVTVCDAPLANYTDPPDLSIFDEYEGIETHVTQGRFSDDYTREHIAYFSEIRKRNFFYYALMKVSAPVLQPLIYDEGNYCSTSYKPTAHNQFRYSYPVLTRLVEFTEINDGLQNTFMMIDNETPHGSSILQLPDYKAALEVDNSGYNTTYRIDDNGNRIDLSIGDRWGHYSSLMAGMLRLSEWFQYMKDNGIYDNTKIIISSDHGWGIGLYPEVDAVDVNHYNPIMLVKDFNSTQMSTSNEFMTNADVPSIAFEDCIKEPVNPFTGKIVDCTEKYKHPQIITATNDYFVYQEDYTYRTEGTEWISVVAVSLKNDNLNKLGSAIDIDSIYYDG